MFIVSFGRHWALMAALAAAALTACGGASTPDSAAQRESPAGLASSTAATSIEALRLPTATAAQAPIAASLRAATGPVDVWVELAGAALAAKKVELRPEMAGRGWRDTDDDLKVSLRAHKQVLRGSQDATVGSLRGMGAKELGRVLVAHNAVAVTVDAARLGDIASLPDVVAVRPVRHYELMLGETVPYIGGAAAQAAGFDGTGVRVAVLDSGVDYTHRNLGGAGTAAAYEAAWGTSPGDARNTTRDGLFPTGKVVDGFDFVGEGWPTTARTEDPDPIDLEGHGTHVSDIIAGIGPNKGVAPGAKLVAVKVCSAVATSCNGVALLKGMDFALDPNGDGDLSDAVDVINMSLGSSYGQEEDDLSLAASNAVKLGVSVVVSAGNSANRPYIVGSPSSAPGVLSVAQTQTPSAATFAVKVDSPAAIAGVYGNTATLDFAPVGAGFNGNVKTALQAGAANNLACVALPGGSLAGMVALIDRGTCAISIKVENAANAGATGVLIALVAPGDALSFSFGGGTNFVPAVVIQQSLGNAIKANIAAPVHVTVDNSTKVDLVGSMAGTSSRGPGFSDTALKPEIGAPGASVSAEATTGTGETAFGGTSGASPMVAGSAAILRGAFPDRSPDQIKAMLMNSANTTIFTNPAVQPGVLAPVSRIGAGEVRVDRALALTTIVRNPKARTAALPFGFAEVAKRAELHGELLIENFSNVPRTYTLAANYRYADDAASGATRIELPRTVTVSAHGKARVDVEMKVDGSKLPLWNFASAGADGGNGALLEGNEVDGYVTVSGGGQTMSVPFHALLRRSSSVDVTGDHVKVGKDIKVRNSGAVQEGAFDIFALTGESPRFKRKLQPQAGDNFALIDLRAVGVRAVGPYLQFAVSRWDRRAHPAYPAEIDIFVDTNNDGIDDFVVYNVEASGFAATGQTLVAVQNLATGASAAYFYLDTDLQSATGIYTVPLAALGLTPTSRFKFSVVAFDNYFTGNLTDSIEGMTYSLGAPRFAIDGGAIDGTVAPGVSVRLTTQSVPLGDVASPSQSGFLLTFRQNKDDEIATVKIKP